MVKNDYKKSLIDYLQYRIDCVQAYLRDLYSTNSDDIEVIKAEVELQVFVEILDELKKRGEDGEKD